jgi:hypothetical protein
VEQCLVRRESANRVAQVSSRERKSDRQSTSEHKKRLKDEIKVKKGELSKIKEEIRAAEGQAKVQQIKRKKRAKQEIFLLQRELRAAKGGMTESQSDTGTLPDFLIIGAKKAGTTFLYNVLTLHPHVEPAAFKELHYFDIRIEEEGTEWYRQWFPSPRWKDGRRTMSGEATPGYLSHPNVPERAARVVPQARLIALLRNPVDRAYSDYHQTARKGREPLTFEGAVEAEEAWLCSERDETSERKDGTGRNQSKYGYLAGGIYVDQLMRWSKFFPHEQLLVLKSEDLFERGPDTLRRVLRFLDLPGWEPEDWEQVPTKRNKGKSYDRGMDPATRQRLEGFFEPHNRRLYEHLGVDFEW